MTTEMKTVLYTVKDLASSTSLFTTLLGQAPHADTPYYVGFNVEGVEVGLVPEGPAGGAGASVAYFDVADIAATVQALVALGAEVLQEPADVARGLLVAKVRDANGAEIGLRQVPDGS